MQLNHGFTIPASLDEAWEALGDVEQVATCMPGASLGSFDGERFEGSVKVKVGPMQLTYRGQGHLTERDESSHRIAIEASGKEARGQGTASATVTAQLTERSPTETEVSVVTDLDVTGKPAQFGRSAMADVGQKLLDRFALQLAELLEGQDEAPAVVPGSEPSPPRAGTPQAAAARPGSGAGDVLDLGELAGGVLLQRLVPVAAVAAVVAAVVAIVWSCRRR